MWFIDPVEERLGAEREARNDALEWVSVCVECGMIDGECDCVALEDCDRCGETIGTDGWRNLCGVCAYDLGVGDDGDNPWGHHL